MILIVCINMYIYVQYIYIYMYIKKVGEVFNTEDVEFFEILSPPLSDCEQWIPGFSLKGLRIEWFFGVFSFCDFKRSTNLGWVYMTNSPLYFFKFVFFWK